MAGNIVPFGKYKGHSVADIAARDPAYLHWLLQQSWFAEQYPHLIINVTHFAPVSEETPAHNVMQVQFLEEGYRKAFMRALLPRADRYATNGVVFETVTDVAFEVEWWWDKNPDVKHGFLMALVEVKPGMGDDYPAVLRQMKKQQEQMQTLERMGRSPFRRYELVWALLLGGYSGHMVRLDQVRRVFATNDIHIVMTDEVELDPQA